MSINEAGLALIKQFESCRLTAYKDVAGKWTIGYGHTDAAGPPAVHAGMTITQDAAEAMLARDLLQYEIAVDGAITVPTNGNEFAALVSLCYNIGPGAFRTSSVCRYLNAGERQDAADAFRLWDKAGGKTLPGLILRREAERRLFLAPVLHASGKPSEAPLPDPAPDTAQEPSATMSAATAPASGIAALVAAALAALAAWARAKGWW